LKVDKVYSDYETIVLPTQLPFWHCLKGNAINHSTLLWCNKHVLGYWGYWFDRQHCLDDWDMTPQIAYVGFSNSIDLFMFRLSAPHTITTPSDLRYVNVYM
jgi:hypothetical protein